MQLEHRFATRLEWDGRTADGYRAYSRAHRGSGPPDGPELALSAAAAFRGDAARLNPEQLLVLAASSCQLLSFLAVAAAAGLDVRSYRDDAAVVLPQSAGPMMVAAIVLRPHVVLGPGGDPGAIPALMQQAHEQCIIANSLRTPITVEATVEVLADPTE